MEDTAFRVTGDMLENDVGKEETLKSADFRVLMYKGDAAYSKVCCGIIREQRVCFQGDTNLKTFLAFGCTARKDLSNLLFVFASLSSSLELTSAFRALAALLPYP